MKSEINREKVLYAFLYTLSDGFLCAFFLVSRINFYEMSDKIICLSSLLAGMIFCLVFLWTKMFSMYIVSVIQAAVFLISGYESGSAASLCFLPLCFAFTFVEEKSRLKQWLLVAGGAWGTYVLFVFNIGSFDFSTVPNTARELVFPFIVSSVFLSVSLSWHMKEMNTKIKQMQKETAYLSLQTDELADQNYRDALTGLPNRRYYDFILPKLIGMNEDFGTPLSLIVIDIDHFKNINDTYGHATGDRVLSALGSLISSSTRDEDTACRYGGEEFVVLMKADLHTAAARAEYIRAKASELNPSDVPMTISCGVAQYTRGANVFTLADNELYRAKEHGRNRVCFDGDGQSDSSDENEER